MFSTSVNNSYKNTAFVGGIVFVFILDRVLKLFAQLWGDQGGIFVYTHNSALAFSLPAPAWILTGAIPVITFVFMVLALQAAWRGRYQGACGYGLLAAGALSNVLDRFFYGGVIDYIQFWIVPVFNLADMMIIVGLLILITERRIA